MDTLIKNLAKNYRKTRDFNGDAKKALHDLYNQYVKSREESLLDAVTATAAVNAIFLSDQVDFSEINPQMKEAFELAFPTKDLGILESLDPGQAQGYLSAWKGKYFEVLVRDKLNDGDWVGDIQLGEGQVAELAEGVTQPGWDLQIFNDDGTVVSELQLKASKSIGYVKDALERYPEIDVISTDEVADHSLVDQIFPSGISNDELIDEVQSPMEALFDSPLEELAEDVLPFLPFVIITVGEGRKVFLGRKTFEQGFSDALERGFKTGTAIGVGALVVLLDGGLLSLPASFLTRLGFDRYKVYSILAKQLDLQINNTRKLLPYYK